MLSIVGIQIDIQTDIQTEVNDIQQNVFTIAEVGDLKGDLRYSVYDKRVMR